MESHARRYYMQVWTFGLVWEKKRKPAALCFLEPRPAWGENGTYNGFTYPQQAISYMEQHRDGSPLFMYLAFQGAAARRTHARRPRHAPTTPPSLRRRPDLRAHAPDANDCRRARTVRGASQIPRAVPGGSTVRTQWRQSDLLRRDGTRCYQRQRGPLLLAGKGRHLQVQRGIHRLPAGWTVLPAGRPVHTRVHAWDAGLAGFTDRQRHCSDPQKRPIRQLRHRVLVRQVHPLPPASLAFEQLSCERKLVKLRITRNFIAPPLAVEALSAAHLSTGR